MAAGGYGLPYRYRVPRTSAVSEVCAALLCPAPAPWVRSNDGCKSVADVLAVRLALVIISSAAPRLDRSVASRGVLCELLEAVTAAWVTISG